MKKLFFSFVMLVTLVIVAGSAKAQSTYDKPFVGAQQIYKWSDVTANSYSYAVTTSPTSPTTNPVSAGTVYNVTSGSLTPAGALAGVASANLGITWLAPSVGNTYYVWLVASSSESCENWRYVTVNPEVNQVDFILAALGLYSKNEAISTLTTASVLNGGNACPTPTLRDGTVYSSDIPDGSSDGNVYAYFKVYEGAKNNNNTWKFSFGIVNDPASPAGSIEYYNGTKWVVYSDPLTGIAHNAVQLLRVMIPTPVATAANATKITGTISSASEETTGLGDSQSNNDQQDYTINRVAKIGAFTGN